MNILFDLYTPQFQIGGAGEYIRKVFYTLLEYIRKVQSDITVYVLIDSSYGKYAYQDLTPESLSHRGVIIADINGLTLKQLIFDYSIDKVFIGCAQYWGARFDIENIKIPTVCIIHDLCEEEYEYNYLNDYILLSNFKKYVRWKVGSFLKGKQKLLRLPPIIKQAKRNNEFKIICVSEYSKNSIAYYFTYPLNKIDVLYSPEREYIIRDGIENGELKRVVSAGITYYLMLSANRPFKNPDKVFHAFKRFVEYGHNDVYLVTTGYKEQKFKNHIPLGYLSDNDLVHLMRHCYALLFPSFFEGFGYPPVEAMSFGKPVLASNVTSMPEVLGDAPIYFSPLYESDIFKALNVLNEFNYEDYSDKSQNRYKKISTRQQQDLDKLIQIIVN